MRNFRNFRKISKFSQTFANFRKFRKIAQNFWNFSEIFGFKHEKGDVDLGESLANLFFDFFATQIDTSQAHKMIVTTIASDSQRAELL